MDQYCDSVWSEVCVGIPVTIEKPNRIAADVSVKSSKLGVVPKAYGNDLAIPFLFSHPHTAPHIPQPCHWYAAFLCILPVSWAASPLSR
jgi:hypothetical protein